MQKRETIAKEKKTTGKERDFMSVTDLLVAGTGIHCLVIFVSSE